MVDQLLEHSSSSRSIKQEVGYYLHGEGPNLGKHRVPYLLLPSTLDAQFGTPYPRSAGFDTDIGAFIESSTVSSSKGSMAPSIINNDAVQGETFLPGQIFVFGGFVLRANSLGHLEQIDSYTSGHQVRFGSLNHVADTREDLIFNGFETAAIAPPRPDDRFKPCLSGRRGAVAAFSNLSEIESPWMSAA